MFLLLVVSTYSISGAESVSGEAWRSGAREAWRSEAEEAWTSGAVEGKEAGREASAADLSLSISQSLLKKEVQTST